MYTGGDGLWNMDNRPSFAQGPQVQGVNAVFLVCFLVPCFMDRYLEDLNRECHGWVLTCKTTTAILSSYGTCT